MYSRSDCIGDASIVFERIAEKDLVSWGSIIAALAQKGHQLKALHLFKQMLDIGDKHDLAARRVCNKVQIGKRATEGRSRIEVKGETSTVKTKDAAAKKLLKPLRTQQCAVETSDYMDQVLSDYRRRLEQLLPPSTVRRHAALRERFADTIAIAKKKILQLDSIEAHMKKVIEQQALEAKQKEELEKLEAEEKAAEDPMKTGVAERSS
ncbi:hypothetical protein J5N97_011283 [Dioscorea zingiberensis]|uniref:Pentatricopeptide repeat-containing protein n=1 Tax=Dioscorea zingiberensis TaxID=325984 RepID=A0A9D5HNG8_9LILI|nr:hypothetical protein J5N97_011283 [Dioscorea zingiberensis]